MESTGPGRVRLRPFVEADIEPLHAIFADPAAMRYWSRPPHADLAETADFVRRTIEASAAGEGDDLIVERDGEVIGKAGLWNGEEIGFIFSPKVWGQGLAREAIEAVIVRARGRGVRRILAEADPRNARCLGLLERVGFVVTGEASATMQVGEDWVDSVYLALDLA